MKEWFSAAELARIGSLGAATVQGINQIARRQGWQRRLAPGSAHAWEYWRPSLPSSALPTIIAASGRPCDETDAKTLLTGTSEEKRRCAIARLTLLAELDRVAKASSLNKALDAMIDLAARGALPEHLQSLVPIANARASTTRALSRRSLLRWRAERANGSAALAPRDIADAPPPAWGAALLDAFRRPQKPSLPQALENLMLPPGVAPPSYHQARRFLAKVSVIERNRGRMGPRALKSLRAFTRRDVSMLEPLDLVLMDGHTFDAEIAHPFHGQPFRPEITTIIDAATRRIVGWSTDLAESANAVSLAIARCVEMNGIPAILYVDNGAGYKAKVISSDAVGLLTRLGTRHESSLPYNSQARGLIERLHATVWVAAAKNLPTFMGAPMDAEAKQKVHKLTRAQIQPFSPPLLKPWRDFRDWVVERIAAYNTRPHRALAKTRVEGVTRRMSPDEAWQGFAAKGWEPVKIDASEARLLLLPMQERVTRRGEVSIAGNTYFNRELEHFTGERVRVSYDPFVADKVWVQDLAGRLLCEAQLDGNKVAFFPRSVVEQARDNRAAGRERRLQLKLDEVRAERLGAPIDGSYREISGVAAEPPAVAPLLAPIEPPAPPPSVPFDPDARPDFSGENPEREHLFWCMAHWDRTTPWDRELVTEVLSSPSRRTLYGIDDDTAARFGGNIPRKIEE